RTRREKSHPFPRQSYRQLTLAQQAEDCLRQLIGLSQHRSTCLLHDLVLGQVGRLGCVVGIHDATASVGGVLSNVLQVADGRLEAVLHRTEVGTGAVYRGDRIAKGLDGQLSVAGTEDIQTVDSVGRCFRYNRIICTLLGQAKDSQTTSRSLISSIIQLHAIFYGKVTERRKINRDVIALHHLGGSYPCAGVIDFVDYLVNSIARFKVDDGTIQLNRGSLCQLATGIKFRCTCCRIFALCQQSYRIAFGMSERRFTSQTFSTHITDTEGQCLARVGANLEAFTGQSTIQQVLATEGGSFSNTGQLARQVGELLVQRLTFFSRVRAVGSLQSQVTHPLHDIGGLLESAFSGLGHGDTIVSVLHGNVQTIDLAGQTVGNLQ